MSAGMKGHDLRGVRAAGPMVLLPGATRGGREMIAVDTSRIFDPAFAGRIRAARLRKRWTKSHLAARSGVSKVRVERAEHQPWRVPLNDLSRIAGALETELAAFSETVFTRVSTDEQVA